MEIRLTLALPRDQLSIPVVRRLCTQSLRVLGARVDCQQDLEVALTEACTNVLNHAGATDDYDVVLAISDKKAVLQIVDAGYGFDASRMESTRSDGQPVAESGPDPEAEAGRGILLMRALTDRLTFQSRPGRGTVVHMEKDLVWDRDAPIWRLASVARSGTEPSPPPAT